MKRKKVKSIPLFQTSGQGFTLLEVIVTFTILGFILLIIFGTFRLGISAWERGTSIKERSQEARMISRLISQQVKSIVPYKIKTQKAEGDYLAFDGKTQSLKFVSALPIKAKKTEGFVYVIYDFKEGGKEGGRLVLYEQRALNRTFFEEQPDEASGVSLLEGVSNVRFEYFRDEDPSKGRSQEWVNEWNAKEEKELPAAFKMTLVKKNGKDKEKEFLITVMAALPSNREEVRTGPLGVGRRTFRRGMGERELK